MKSINKSMFSGCSSLKNILIPSSVTRIGRAAFYQCKSFKEIIIPKSVQYIDRLAFRYCRNLKAVYIPDSVKRIGMYAFSDCQEITTVRRGRSIYREYESMGLIATPPGNKEKIERMLPKYLHDIIKELTYKEFINCNMQLYENIKTEREYDYNYLDRVNVQGVEIGIMWMMEFVILVAILGMNEFVKYLYRKRGEQCFTSFVFYW